MNKTVLLVLGILCLACAFGCEPSAPVHARKEYPVYTAFRSIPGVTAKEIAAIEQLQAAKRSFVFGVTPSTEFFTGEDGTSGGYSVLLCDWLTTLFGMPFTPTEYVWDELLTGLKSHAVDFIGEMTATKERRNSYFMTDAIAQRAIKRIRIQGGAPLSEIEKQRPLRYAFLEGAITRDLIWPFLEQSSEYVFVGNYADAYRLLKDGKIDAFLDASPAEAAFDEHSDVVTVDAYPLLHSPVSLTTQ